MRMEFDSYRLTRPLIAPLTILIGAALLLAASPSLPASLAAIGPVLPWLVLLTGVGLSVLFNRGRTFIAFLSLLAAYAGIELTRSAGISSFPMIAVLTAITILVPANILFALVYAERGVYQHRNYRWWLIAAAETMSVGWVAQGVQRIHCRRRNPPAHGADAGVAPARIPRRVDRPARAPRAEGTARIRKRLPHASAQRGAPTRQLGGQPATQRRRRRRIQSAFGHRQHRCGRARARAEYDASATRLGPGPVSRQAVRTQSRQSVRTAGALRILAPAV